MKPTEYDTVQSAQVLIEDVETWMARLEVACAAAGVAFDPSVEMECSFGYAYEGTA